MSARTSVVELFDRPAEAEVTRLIRELQAALVDRAEVFRRYIRAVHLEGEGAAEKIMPHRIDGALRVMNCQKALCEFLLRRGQAS